MAERTNPFHSLQNDRCLLPLLVESPTYMAMLSLSRLLVQGFNKSMMVCRTNWFQLWIWFIFNGKMKSGPVQLSSCKMERKLTWFSNSRRSYYRLSQIKQNYCGMNLMLIWIAIKEGQQPTLQDCLECFYWIHWLQSLLHCYIAESTPSIVLMVLYCLLWCVDTYTRIIWLLWNLLKTRFGWAHCQNIRTMWQVISGFYRTTYGL